MKSSETIEKAPDMTVLELAQLMSGYASDMEKRFDDMDARFDRLEHIVLPSHDRRIEKLEDESRHVRTYLKLA